ncbi:MAG: hypothetical protein MJ179_10125 [Treponema sp.]|nr:hypothetical protein [Treponema sp.]
MEIGHLFETLMLICFGFSWPLNVIKAYKARTTKGTSLAFILLIITGYVAGIAAKFLNNQINYVLAAYFINLAIVMTNVVVYFRNLSLDKKNESKVTKIKIYELQQKYKDTTNTQEKNMNYQELNGIAKTNQVVLMGGSMDQLIPVTELAQSFSFNFELYNRSSEKLSVKNAVEYFNNMIAPITPEGIIIHLGDEDLNLFTSNPTEFDKYYLDLLSAVSACNRKMRIALVSVNNPSKNEVIKNMNAHIKSIASSSKCQFVNLDNAALWTPKANKAALDFAYSMGLQVRKPLLNVAEILYSYACLELKAETLDQTLVG